MRQRRGWLIEYLPVADLLVRQGGWRFRVVSNSMVPTLHPGDLVELNPVGYDELRQGEIVVVPLNGRLICHRLARWIEGQGTRWVVTRGDRLATEDPPIPADQVVGRVARVLPPRLFHHLFWRVRGWAAARVKRWRQ